MNKFITFEGIDACGKTTQINLLSDFLKIKKNKNLIVREPGGTQISEKIRNILLDNNNNISDETETLLFLSARSQLINEIIMKNINKNNFTLCDRYIDSTVAYQGYGRGLSLDKIQILNSFATRDIKPDLTFILDIDVSESMVRLGGKKDRMEESGREFLEKVRYGYQNLAKTSEDRFRFINCMNRDIKDINEEIIYNVKDFYKGALDE